MNDFLNFCFLWMVKLKFPTQFSGVKLERKPQSKMAEKCTDQKTGRNLARNCESQVKSRMAKKCTDHTDLQTQFPCVKLEHKSESRMAEKCTVNSHISILKCQN